MNFSIRTLMIHVTYIALAIAAWCSDSQIFLALTTFFFAILILRTVACSLIAVENRTYWLGSAAISCGILLTSPYLVIFDAIADYEDIRRHAWYANPSVLLTPLPPPAIAPTTALSPPTSASFPPTIPPTLPTSTTLPTWQPVPSAAFPAPYAASLSFRFSGGFSVVLKAFLVNTVAYLAGVIAGVICMRVSAQAREMEPPETSA